MKTLEFQTSISDEGTLTAPADIVRQLPQQQPVRVILVPEDTGDQEWQQLTQQQFLSGYAESDAIYDQL